MVSLGVLVKGEKASATGGSSTETVGVNEPETSEDANSETLAGAGSETTNGNAVPEPITGLIIAAGLGGAALKRAKDKSKKS